jgi:hypothetical protein
MVRTLDFIMIAALIGTAGYTFKIKHDAEQAAARVETLETRLRLEREAIDILKADWSLLTSPDRLERLVERHKEELGLEPASPRQIVTIDKIPERPPELAPIDGEELPADGREASTADGPGDDTVTGSIAGTEDEAPEELPEGMPEPAIVGEEQ